MIRRRQLAELDELDVSTPMKRGLLIYNPTAGQRDRRAADEELIGAREARGGSSSINAPTTRRDTPPRSCGRFFRPGSTSSRSAAATERSRRPPAGSRAPTCRWRSCRAGTSNVLARELAIPLDLERRDALLFDGRAAPGPPPPRQRPAVPALGGRGPGRAHHGPHDSLAETLARPHRDLLHRRPEFFRYEFPRLEVTVDGERHEATFAVVCHARHYAGDWIIAPEAALDSDEMDVLLFAGPQPLEVLLALPPDPARQVRAPDRGPRPDRARPLGHDPLPRDLSGRGPGGRRLRAGDAGHLPPGRCHSLDPGARREVKCRCRLSS